MLRACYLNQDRSFADQTAWKLEMTLTLSHSLWETKSWLSEQSTSDGISLLIGGLQVEVVVVDGFRSPCGAESVLVGTSGGSYLKIHEK